MASSARNSKKPSGPAGSAPTSSSESGKTWPHKGETLETRLGLRLKQAHARGLKGQAAIEAAQAMEAEEMDRR